jgi:hypothetical protein
VRNSQGPLSLIYNLPCLDSWVCGNPAPAAFRLPFYGSLLALELRPTTQNALGWVSTFLLCLAKALATLALQGALCRDICTFRYPQAAELTERMHPRHVGLPYNPHYQVRNKETVLISPDHGVLSGAAWLPGREIPIVSSCFRETLLGIGFPRLFTSRHKAAFFLERKHMNADERVPSRDCRQLTMESVICPYIIINFSPFSWAYCSPRHDILSHTRMSLTLEILIVISLGFSPRCTLLRTT